MEDGGWMMGKEKEKGNGNGKDGFKRESGNGGAVEVSA